MNVQIGDLDNDSQWNSIIQKLASCLVHQRERRGCLVWRNNWSNLLLNQFFYM